LGLESGDKAKAEIFYGVSFHLFLSLPSFFFFIPFPFLPLRREAALSSSLRSAAPQATGFWAAANAFLAY